MNQTIYPDMVSDPLPWQSPPLYLHTPLQQHMMKSVGPDYGHNWWEMTQKCEQRRLIA